jgi:hypothetical protein
MLKEEHVSETHKLSLVDDERRGDGASSDTARTQVRAFERRCISTLREVRSGILNFRLADPGRVLRHKISMATASGPRSRHNEGEDEGRVGKDLF